MWFGNNTDVHGEGRNFIENREENNKSYKNSLSKLSMVETRFALDLSSKATSRDLYRLLRSS